MTETGNILSGLDSAKLYLEASLDASYRQAMYDNGINGGLAAPETPENPNNLECEMKCTGASEYLGSRTLIKGDRGLQIGSLQCVLSNLVDAEGKPYLDDKIDCIFGDKTEAALMSFQKNRSVGLLENGEADGRAAPETLNMLEKAFSENWDNCADFFDRCHYEGYWTDPPTEEDILAALKRQISKNMDKWTREKYVFRDYAIKIPGYPESGLHLDWSGDNVVLAATGDSMISYKKTDDQPLGKEMIKLEKDSSITRTYTKIYPELYAKSVEVFNSLKLNNACEKLEEGTLMDAVSEGDFVISATVQEKKDPCEATVLVNVTDTRQKFNVYDGTKNTLGYVSMQFYMRF